MKKKSEATITVSPSQIGMLSECPRCLWLHFREGLRRPAGIFPSLPGGFDLLFKGYFNSFRGKSILPPELDGKVEGKLFDEIDKLNIWRNNRVGIRAEFPEMNLIVKGAIDDLLLNKAGEFVPLDFKTRGYPTKEDTASHYQTQLDLYALLFEKNGYDVAPYGYLLFFWPKKYAKHSAEFETELIKMEVSPKRAIEKLKEVMLIIKGKKPTAHIDCEFCRFREFNE